MSATRLLTALAALQLFHPHVSAQSNSADDACGEAANQQTRALRTLDSELYGDVLFAKIDAKIAYDCISAVPLDADEASIMIQAIKEYVAFQTTLAYNEDPPESYQQPRIDIQGQLDELISSVEDGVYENQYDFDIKLRSIMIGSHDGHLQVDTGVLGLFSWLLPDTIVTVSSDGQAIPEVYARSDILNDIQEASPIVEIEGESVFAYLKSYVNRTGVNGLLEPHAEWNQLMWNAPYQFGIISVSGSMSDYPAYFERTVIYNGESISGQFKNGSSFEWAYEAGAIAYLEDSDLTSIENIQDLMVRIQEDGFGARSVNGKRSAAIKIKSPRDYHRSLILPPRDTHNDGNSSVPMPNYPTDPIVVQEDLGVGGSVTGYILEDISVGVLSLPNFMSFVEGSGSSKSFSDAVDEFITKAKDAEVQKVIIDLSGNGGGAIFQGFDVFKRFFPDLEPSVGFRTRASPYVNVIGALLTGVIENDDFGFDRDVSEELLVGYGTSIPFTSSLSLDLDGNPWESWNDFFGPREIHGDNFTNTAQYNLSNPAIPKIYGQHVAGYGNNPIRYEQPWAAEDIILLQDGGCASTCAIFSEIMNVDAGVKTVVAGGIPQYGPMQGISGTRGSNTMPFSVISGTVDLLQELADDEDDAIDSVLAESGLTTSDLRDLPTLLDRLPWAVRGGQVNILDMVRPDTESPDDPFQFSYQAADCRIFYTAAMIRDVTEVWRTAAKVAEGDMSVCVEGSTNGYGLDTNDTFFDDPGFSGEDVWANANSTELLSEGPAADDEDDDSGAAGVHARIGGVLIAAAVAVVLTV